MKIKISAIILSLIVMLGTAGVAGAEAINSDICNFAFSDSKNTAVTVKGCLGKEAAKQVINIKLNKNGAEKYSYSAETDYRGGYSLKFDFSESLNDYEVVIEYGEASVKADIKNNEYGDFKINAYRAENGIVCVEGYSSARYAGASVNILLTDKNSPLNLSDLSGLAHIGVCKADKSGHFVYKFTYDGDTDDYRLLVTMKGILPIEVNIAENENIRPRISLGMTDKNGRSAALNGAEYESIKALADTRLSGGVCADLFAAYYDENEALIGVDSRVNFKFDFNDSGIAELSDFLPNIPQNADSVKLMVWENNLLKPLGEAEKLPSEITKKYFYVAPNGSDLNDGSFSKPLATLQGAQNAVRQYK